MAEENQAEFDLEAAIEEAEKNGGLVDLDKKEEKTNEKQPSPEETILNLQKQLGESKIREQEARDIASRAESDKQAEVSKTISAIDLAFRDKEVSIESRLSAATSSLSSIKQQLKIARTNGDIDAEIELEEKLADERYQLNAITWEKNNLAGQKKQREDAAKNAVDQPSVRKHTAREQEWINSHPRYDTDEEYQAEVWKLDGLAKKRGIRADTDAYYEYINKGLDKTYPSEQTSGNTTTRQNNAASTAAPASRTSGTVQRIGTNGNKVRLSAEQLDAAEACGMTPAEYAADLINIENEKLGRA